jgi:methyl-accepting chemotaxis protein
MFASLFRRSSIKTKLMLSMAACLMLFLVISSTLSVSLTGKGLRERAVEQELPAVVGAIRNDILRQIGGPVSASLAVANNTFLHGWEREGLPESGMAA